MSILPVTAQQPKTTATSTGNNSPSSKPISQAIDTIKKAPPVGGKTSSSKVNRSASEDKKPTTSSATTKAPLQKKITSNSINQIAIASVQKQNGQTTQASHAIKTNLVTNKEKLQNSVAKFEEWVVDELSLLEKLYTDLNIAPINRPEIAKNWKVYNERYYLTFKTKDEIKKYCESLREGIQRELSEKEQAPLFQALNSLQKKYEDGAYTKQIEIFHRFIAAATVLGGLDKFPITIQAGTDVKKPITPSLLSRIYSVFDKNVSTLVAVSPLFLGAELAGVERPLLAALGFAYAATAIKDWKAGATLKVVMGIAMAIMPQLASRLF